MDLAEALAPYLAHVARLFPGVRVRVVRAEPRDERANRVLRADAELGITLHGRTTRLYVEAKRTHLATAVAHALVGALGAHAPKWILFAPYVGRPLGGFLAAHGLNYVDLKGNCHLRVGGQLAAHVEGRPLDDATRRPKGFRPAGVRALLALLVDPDLLAAPGRDIARAAGTTHPTALAAVRRLGDAGAVVADGQGRRWMPGGLRVALDRWIDEYETVLRTALVAGRYRTPDRAPPDLDQRLADWIARGGGAWLGGAAAGFRIAPHHRGDTTVVHVDGDGARLLRTLRAVPDPAGPLWLMGLPGPLAARGLTTDTVHPLLVYAEMLHVADDRTLEAAQRFRERALGAYA